MKIKKILFIVIAVLALMVITVVAYGFWENTALELNAISVTEENLPEAFDGFRIAHISDLHSAEMGKENKKLLTMLQQAEPDIICITGDMMDCRDESADVALCFAEEAVKIAPCYYVTGNHEVRLADALYRELIDGLISAGVTVLHDKEALLTRDGQSISVVGHFWGDTAQVGELSDFDGYRMLLSHQPEDLENYAAGDYELVLCGHAHGGQIRLPILGGIIAPGQGLFPKYTSGLYSSGKTDMIVSRGIGNSGFPFRLNNPPEVVLILLECT